MFSETDKLVELAIDDRLTSPEKLPRLVGVIVELAEDPGFSDTELGLAERVKSGAWLMVILPNMAYP
jgi:hypothetical protein